MPRRRTYRDQLRSARIDRGKFGAAAFERLVELLQPQVRVAETAVCGLKRRERLQENRFRCLENSLFLFHRASRQQALEQSSLMDLSNVQETKLAGDGNAAEF